MVSSRNKGQIYGIGATYSGSYSLAFVFGAGLTITDMEDIHNQVHAMNESVHKQLKKADRRYMELHKRHEKEKE